MACGTLAGLGLAAAGTGVDMYANNQVRNNMNGVVNQEVARNQGFQNKAQNVFNQSMQQSTPQAANQQIGQGQQQLQGLIQQAQAVPLSASMPSFGVANTMAQEAKTGMSNKAASDLGGYSNYTLQQRLKDQQAGSQLGVINNEAQGWANILPAQLQQAQGSEQGLQSLGQLLGMAGMLTGIGSATATPAALPSSAQLGALQGGWGPMTAQAAGNVGTQMAPLTQQDWLMSQLYPSMYN